MIYKIPLWLRTNAPSGLVFRSFKKSKYIKVDGIGLLAFYNDEKELEPSYIRRCLICRQETQVLIEASSPEEAIFDFFNKWEGARIGGTQKGEKALWINTENEIIELPACKLIHKNKRNQYICGELDEDYPENGIFGMCILEDYDPPPDCPIANFKRNIWKLKQKGVLLAETLEMQNEQYKIIRAHTHPHLAGNMT